MIIKIFLEAISSIRENFRHHLRDIIGLEIFLCLLANHNPELRCVICIDVTLFALYVCVRILNWPLPIGAFQDQCKQTMINTETVK